MNYITIENKKYITGDIVLTEAPIYSKGSRSVRDLIKKKRIENDKFIYARKVGDKLVITDSSTSELTTITITGLEMEHAQKTIYNLDFEPSDLFLVDIGDGDFSVMHNACWCPWNYCGHWCNDNTCPSCNNAPPAKI